MDANVAYEVHDADEVRSALSAVPPTITTVIFLGRDKAAEGTVVLADPSDTKPSTLTMLRALNSVRIDDTENEPPDFTVPGDDLGY